MFLPYRTYFYGDHEHESCLSCLSLRRFSKNIVISATVQNGFTIAQSGSFVQKLTTHYPVHDVIDVFLQNTFIGPNLKGPTVLIGNKLSFNDRTTVLCDEQKGCNRLFISVTAQTYQIIVDKVSLKVSCQKPLQLKESKPARLFLDLSSGETLRKRPSNFLQSNTPEFCLRSYCRLTMYLSIVH